MKIIEIESVGNTETGVLRTYSELLNFHSEKVDKELINLYKKEEGVETTDNLKNYIKENLRINTEKKHFGSSIIYTTFIHII